jgi:hypothetical protein
MRRERSVDKRLKAGRGVAWLDHRKAKGQYRFGAIDQKEYRRLVNLGFTRMSGNSARNVELACAKPPPAAERAMRCLGWRSVKRWSPW